MDRKGIGGWCLIGAAAVTIMMMAHHPSDMRSGGVGQFVHGALIVSILVTAFGFAAFVADRGAGRATMMAGAIAYSVSVFANIGAGTINGFVAPALAAGTEQVGPGVMRLAWELNQALAGLAVYAMAAAFLFWSIDLVRREGMIARLVGLAGLVAALLPPVLLISGVLRMNVTGASIVYGVVVAWGFLVGLLMLAESRRATG